MREDSGTSLLEAASEQTSTADRRSDRRLDIRLPVEVRKANDEPTCSALSVTRNVSTGGAFLEMSRTDLRVGDRIHVRLSIPPMEGVSPYAQRAECQANIIRVCEGEKSEAGIAIRFLDRLRFS